MRTIEKLESLYSRMAHAPRENRILTDADLDLIHDLVLIFRRPVAEPQEEKQQELP